MLFIFLSNGVYQLKNNHSLEEYQVYCHMTEISGCGSGDWTLVMKIDGDKVIKIILNQGIFSEEFSERHTFKRVTNKEFEIQKLHSCDK